jgi:aspartate carbamoyltransferase catalytic subunit
LTTDTGSELQRDHAGRLRHLLTLDGLSRDELSHLLDLAQFYVRVPGELPARDQSLWGRTVANLFFEPSTRTRVSFELAAKRLGADVVNLDMQSSSRVKGETVLDTIYTLQAMQVDVFVMRDSEPGLPAFVAAHVAAARERAERRRGARLAPDAGPARRADHPPAQGRRGNLSVAIVGDLRHSRVARSTGRALLTLGVGELRLVSPESLMPEPDELAGRRATHSHSRTASAART